MLELIDRHLRGVHAQKKIAKPGISATRMFSLAAPADLADLLVRIKNQSSGG
jgi:hypothetical protein